MALGSCGIRPRIQRRDRSGISPASLFGPNGHLWSNETTIWRCWAAVKKNRNEGRAARPWVVGLDPLEEQQPQQREA